MLLERDRTVGCRMHAASFHQSTIYRWPHLEAKTGIWHSQGVVQQVIQVMYPCYTTIDALNSTNYSGTLDPHQNGGALTLLSQQGPSAMVCSLLKVYCFCMYGERTLLNSKEAAKNYFSTKVISEDTFTADTVVVLVTNSLAVYTLKVGFSRCKYMPT